MSNPTVPDEVRRFILTSILSVPYLEALLLLRAERMRSWNSFGVAGRLYIAEPHALELLESLTQAGVARRNGNGSFVYAPATPGLAALLDALAATYSQDLLGVTDLIHSARSKHAQQFADAFRWRKEGE